MTTENKLHEYMRLATGGTNEGLADLLRAIKVTLTGEGPSATAVVGGASSGKAFLRNVWLTLLCPAGPGRGSGGVMNLEPEYMQTHPFWLQHVSESRVVFVEGDLPKAPESIIQRFRDIARGERINIERRGQAPVEVKMKVHIVLFQQSATVQIPRATRIELYQNPIAKDLHDELNNVMPEESELLLAWLRAAVLES